MDWRRADFCGVGQVFRDACAVAPLLLLGHPCDVRYIDSGKREPDQALGSWLAEIADDPHVKAMRLQAGFFSADGLGLLAPLLRRLSREEQVLRILIGSNEGSTRRSDVSALLALLGRPREGLAVGVVAFANSFFHPKVVHAERNDGSIAAYVGSANLTRSGVGSLNVEAGLILDTRDGDDPEVLTSIGSSVDEWFDECRNGLFRIAGASDLDELERRGVLISGREATRRVAISVEFASSIRADLQFLAPLVTIPPLGHSAARTGTTAAETSSESELEDYRPTALTIEAQWSKTLTRSDAQRKSTGNQRGSITLTKSTYAIDAQSYFRQDFFGSMQWSTGITRTGQEVQSALVPMLISIDGLNLGEQELEVTHAPNRESGQHNYTTLVHLGALAPYFANQDMTNKSLTLLRRSDGSFSLAIS